MNIVVWADLAEEAIEAVVKVIEQLKDHNLQGLIKEDDWAEMIKAIEEVHEPIDAGYRAWKHTAA